MSSPYLALVPRSYEQAVEANQRQHAFNDFCAHEYRDAKAALAMLRRAAAHGFTDEASMKDTLNMCDDIESTFNARRTELESALCGIGG